MFKKIKDKIDKEIDRRLDAYFTPETIMYWTIVRFSVTFTLLVFLDPYGHFYYISEYEGIWSNVFIRENGKFSFTQSKEQCYYVLIFMQTILSNLIYSLYEKLCVFLPYIKDLFFYKRKPGVKVVRSRGLKKKIICKFLYMLGSILWSILLIYVGHIQFFLVVDVLFKSFWFKELYDSFKK